VGVETVGVCQYCDDDFLYIRKAKKRKYCSTSCKDKKKYHSRTIKSMHFTGYKNKIRKLLGGGKIGPCSICNYDKTQVDVHHIRGRDTKDANNLNNLCLLCKNCHNEVHEELIKEEELKDLSYLEEKG
jgi:5-methylcytosine-specific restriction endonuclease McrA